MIEDNNLKQVNLGEATSFTAFPHQVEIEGQAYFLTICDNQYRLLSSLCPHAGGQVVIYQSKLVCPLHMWTFDTSSGQCLIARGASLAHYPVVEQDGCLIAWLS